MAVVPIYGIALVHGASGTSPAGSFVSADILLEGNSGSGWTTIPSTQYRIHPRAGVVEKRQYDSTSGAEVDWSAYQAYQDAGNTAMRATYSMYDEATSAITTGSPYAAEAQSVGSREMGNSTTDATGVPIITTTPIGGLLPLIANYLSLGDEFTRPTDSTHGTGVWADKLGVVGLNADTQEFVLSAVTGKATFGAGAVTNDVNGITIVESGTKSDTRSYKFQSSGTTVSRFSSYTSGGARIIDFETVAQPAIDSRVNITATSPATYFSLVTLKAFSNPSSAQINLFADSDATTPEYIALSGVSTLKVGIAGAGGSFVPSTLLHLKSGAPDLLFEDTTASAKSAYIKNDANHWILYEYNVGTPVAILDIDLTTASPALKITHSGLVGYRSVSTAASGASSGSAFELYSDDGAAIASGDRLGYFGFGGADDSAHTLSKSAQLTALATENWSSTAWGSKFQIETVTPTTTTRVVRATIDQLGITSALDLYSTNANFMIRTKATLSNGAAANAGTLTNAPAVGNPTKWIPIDDNGTTRYLPAW